MSRRLPDDLALHRGLPWPARLGAEEVQERRLDVGPPVRLTVSARPDRARRLEDRDGTGGHGADVGLLVFVVGVVGGVGWWGRG